MRRGPGNQVNAGAAVRLAAALVLSLLAGLTMIRFEAAAANGLVAASFADIPGWTDDDHAAALRTFARSCARMVKSRRPVRALSKRVDAGTVAGVCGVALHIAGTADRAAAQAYFERHFVPYRAQAAGDQSLFTGYFEPEYAGSRVRTIAYHVPLYRKPRDFRQPYFDRRQIETGALDGRGLELVFLASQVDAFFVHVQGSARIMLRDGAIMRVGFAAKSGHPYTAIGKVLIDRGVLKRGEVTMQSIRTWLEQNPAAAQQVMWRNRSFIFFREVAGDPDLGPVGAQGIGLDALRSIAVDASLYSYGLPMWLVTTLPVGADGERRPFRRLMISQDTGSAVQGTVRADIFIGSGHEAGEIAGRMKERGRMFVLMPRAGVPARSGLE